MNLSFRDKDDAQKKLFEMVHVFLNVEEILRITK